MNPNDEKYLIRPKFSPGDLVDYVYKGTRGGAGPGGQYGLPVSTQSTQINMQQPLQPFHGIPGTTQTPSGQHMLAVPNAASKSMFQKAIEEGKGARRRAVVDARLSDTEYRLMIRDSGDIVWAHVEEMEPLDAISNLGDLVGPGGKTLGDLANATEGFDIPKCADCAVALPAPEDQHKLNGLGRARCKGCFDKKLNPGG